MKNLLSHLFNRIFNRIKKNGHINELKKHQWLTEAELKEIQERNLRRTIEHAYKNVPFYHNLFNSEKISPSDIKTVSDLKKLPIISKKDVQEHYPKNILSRKTDFIKCRTVRTSGSTGLPLKLSFSEEDMIYRYAVFDFVWREFGVKIFDKTVSIRHYPNYKRDWLKKLGIWDRRNISIFSLHDDMLKDLIIEKPDVIYTFPSILYLLKEKLKDAPKESLNPKVIFTTGETLSPNLKEELSNIYKSDIIDIYAAMEFPNLAFECNEHRGYHVITDAVVLEILKNGKKVNPGEKGEVVVTGLHNDAMPLIRYNLGDIAIFSAKNCPCGRGFPLIEKIEGRKDDFFILPSGRTISPRMINQIEFLTGIAAYKIIQESTRQIIVKVVKNEEFSDNTIREIKRVIKSGCSGEPIEVEVEIVEELSKEKTGKLKTVISKVKNAEIDN